VARQAPSSVIAQRLRFLSRSSGPKGHPVTVQPPRTSRTAGGAVTMAARLPLNGRPRPRPMSCRGRPRLHLPNNLPSFLSREVAFPPPVAYLWTAPERRPGQGSWRSHDERSELALDAAEHRGILPRRRGGGLGVQVQVQGQGQGIYPAPDGYPGEEHERQQPRGLCRAEPICGYLSPANPSPSPKTFPSRAETRLSSRRPRLGRR
jgi:hypothetical protein